MFSTDRKNTNLNVFYNKDVGKFTGELYLTYTFEPLNHTHAAQTQTRTMPLC